jgi:hypothetical protein
VAGSFEEALNIAASSTALQGSGGSDAVVIDRNGVTGAVWLDEATRQSICTWAISWPKSAPDLFWWTQAKDSNDGSTLTWLVGIQFNWAFFNDATKPWQVFVQKSAEILRPLGSWPGESDSYSPNSVTYGANMITGLNQLLDRWIPKFKSWADGIDAPDGDFQGSAAGVLKQRVIAFQNQLRSISDQLVNPDLAGTLNAVAGDMAQVARNLSQAYDEWLSGIYWTPGSELYKHFTNAIENKTITLAPDLDSVPIEDALKISTPYGDPMTLDFWTNIENAAKADWLAGLAGLDASATNFISTLSTVYTQAAAELPPIIVSPPSPPSESKSGGDGNFNFSDLFNGGGSGKKPGGNFKIPDSLTSGKSGGSDPGLTGGGNSGLNLHNPGADAGRLSSLFSDSGPGPGTPPPGGLSLIGSGGTGGRHDTITSPDGTRYTVPPGSKIGLDGMVFGPDGKPVLGGNGKQIKVPKGSKITAGDSLGDDSPHQDSLLGPDGKPVLGPDGKPLKVPAGTTVRPDGSVVGPDGKPVPGANGKPLTVPKGSYLTQNGGSLGGPPSSTKNPYDEFLESRSGGARGLDRILGGPSGITKGGIAGPLVTGGGGGPSSMGGLRTFSSGMGMSDRARGLIDPEGAMGLTTNREGAGPGSQAAEELAQEEAMMGRVSTVGGSGSNEPGMMPPMTGGMGGMGGGGGGATPRKAWVTEDEETWGTTSAGTKGAIGR